MDEEHAAPLRPPPLDLSHHFSRTTKRRLPSQIKQFYHYFFIPGIGNFAGGLPNAQFFPYDTLEAQAAKPERWSPTPNGPAALALAPGPARSLPAGETGTESSGGAGPASSPASAASHITVPKLDTQADLLKRIDLATALQYGTSDGYPPLRSFVRQFTRDHLHPNVPYRDGPEIILSCGSTDGFAKTLEMLVDPWTEGHDPIEERPALLCEVFMYGNVLTQSLPKGVNIVPVELDSEGMLASGPGGLEEVLSGWDEKKGRRPRMMYTVTMGHNPTSGVLSVNRRKEIYALCQKYDVIIVEDDPYWYLQYPSAAAEEARSRNLPVPADLEPAAAEDADAQRPRSSGYEFLDSLVPSYLSIDTDGRVIRLDTFSKTIAPGCRLGWITAQPDFIDKFMRISEVTTQQPSGFVQSMVAELLLATQPAEVLSAFRAFTLSLSGSRPAPAAQHFSGWRMDGWVRWLSGLRGAYERRMTTMCRILDAGSTQLKQSTPLRSADAEWGVVTKTQLYSFAWARGGMFVWLRLHLDTHPLWQAKGVEFPVLDGEVLSTALMILGTRRPHLVLSAPGVMFAATPQIRRERAWAYVRLCFAAESDENVEACSKRYAALVQRFWRIKRVEEIEELAKEFTSGGYAAQGMVASAVEGENLAGYFGC